MQAETEAAAFLSNLVDILLLKFYCPWENHNTFRPNHNHFHRDVPKTFLLRESCHLEKFQPVPPAVWVVQLSFKRSQPFFFITKALFYFLFL